MKIQRSLPLVLLLGTVVTTACLERIDTGAARGNLEPTGGGGSDVAGTGGASSGTATGGGGVAPRGGGGSSGSGVPDAAIVEPDGEPPEPPPSTPTTALGTPGIEFVTPTGEASSTTTPCEATAAHAMTILTLNCAPCHGGRNPGERLGQPPFDYVLNVEKLIAERSASVPDPLAPAANRIPGTPNFQGMRFVIPGDPDNSRLYLRALNKEMPPPPIVGMPDTVTSRPTVSDFSVLRQWIGACLEEGGGDDGDTDGGGGDDDPGDPGAGDAGADAARGR
jgi:hypothetical protein